MYSHKNILRAALAFSASVGILIALPWFAVGVWLSSMEDPSIDGAVRGAGLVTFFVAPYLALASILVSVPITYASQKWRPHKFWVIAFACMILSVCALSYFFIVGLQFETSLFLAAFLCMVLIGSSYVWWKFLPCSNTTIKRDA